MKRLILLLAVGAGGASALEPLPVPPNLANVRRIFIDKLGGGAEADQMRDMLIAALMKSKLFLLTENSERADAFLRGSADDKIYEEDHTSSDSIGIHANSGSGGSSSSMYGAGSSSHQNGGAGITDSESSHSRERKHEASAAIRLVDCNNDVIWSTTQESPGGKFRGAMADIAEKIAHKLVEDYRKAREDGGREAKAPLP
jgi:hypothetical protein